MKIRYSGPHASVEIPGVGIEAKHGELIEVDDEVGKALLEQSTWEKSDQKADKPVEKGGK